MVFVYHQVYPFVFSLEQMSHIYKASACTLLSLVNHEAASLLRAVEDDEFSKKKEIKAFKFM